MNQYNDKDPNDEPSKNSSIVLEKFKKGGSAGSKGVDFQVGLLSVALLNAFKEKKQWRLSTENDGAGKFDDLVLECPDGDVLIQAKQIENRQKTVTLNDFMSTNPNGTFSLAKYFASYVQDIKDKFNTTSIIICTNAAVDDKAKTHLEPVNNFSKSILYYPDASCSFYRFKHTMVEGLKDNIPIYYQNQSKITYNAKETPDDDIKEFLDKLQVCCNYPSGEPMEKAVEQVLSHSKYAKSPYGQVSQLEISAKVKQWFQQKGKVHYLNDILTKAIFFDIFKDKYFKRLSQYNTSFQNQILRYLQPKGIYLLVTAGPYLSQELRLYEELKVCPKNVLYLYYSDINTEIQQEIIDTFRINKYKILLIVFPNASKTSVVKVHESLQQIVNKSTDKMVILISALSQSIPCRRIYFASSFKQISPLSQQALSNREVLNFQGCSTTLKALLGSTFPNSVEELDSETVDKLIKNEDIKVGIEMAPLESYYINREFIRHGVVFTEDSIFEIKEKVILISDGAGNGKTTVLKKLASVIKEKYPHLWIIRIELNEYSHKFRKLLEQQQDINIAQLLEFNDVEKLVFSIEEKVILMVDAVDEISPDYKDIILNLLRQCQQARNFAKIYITTRPHITEELEEVLKVDWFKLKPFTERNQIEFLKIYWAHNLDLTDEELERYAALLLKKTSLWVKTYRAVAAIPLQVRMLGEIFQENGGRNGSQNWQGCREYLRDDREELEMDIAHLYQMFVEKKRHIFINKGNPWGNAAAIDALNRRFDEFLTYYENLALEIKFGKVNCYKLFTSYQKVNINTDEHVFKMGIIQKIGDKITFVHFTFLEYFLAKRLVIELQKPKKSDIFQAFFIKRILNFQTYNVIRAFIDDILKSEEYSSDANIPKTNTFSWYGAPIIDSNLIYILAREGLVNILKQLFNHLNLKIRTGKEINVSGLNIIDKTGKTPLHHAADNGHVKMAEFLVDKGANVNSLDMLNNSPLYYACMKGHINVAEFLIQNGADINSSDIIGDTLLHKAANGGNLEIVQYLIWKKLNVDVLNKNKCSPLSHACTKGHTNVVECLIQNGADINSSDKWSNTPLHKAADGGRLKVVQHLIEKKVNVNSLNENKCSPLYYACMNGHTNVVQLLIQNGADIDSSDKVGDTPLHAAADRGHLKVVLHLIEKKVNVNGLNENKSSPLYYACMKGHIDVVGLLIQNGADINSSDTFGDTPLHMAADGGRLKVAQYLIDKQVNVNSLNQYRYSPLHYACMKYHINVAEFLIQNGADINTSDIIGDTPLHKAAYGGYLKLVQYLIEKKVNVNILNEIKCSPLHYACMKRHKNVVELLIQNGADINSSDINGDTPLHLAAERGCLKVVQYLIKKRVDVNSLNKCKRSPLHNACIKGSINVVELLIQNGADINSSDTFGDTPLHAAADRGHLEVVQYLTEKKVNVNSLNKNNCSPLHIACKKGHISIVDSLIQNGADINSLDNGKNSPLHYASCNHLHVVKFLIQNQACVNILNERMYSPLHFASAKGQLDIARYLIAHGANANSLNKNFHFPINLALMNGHLDIAELLSKRQQIPKLIRKQQ